MSKILYITPHLSTGGLPQYLLKKIEKVINDHDVFLLEWEDIAPIYKVQKDAIKKLIPINHFIFWPQNMNKYLKIKTIKALIEREDFDIIHIEEFPEYFLPDELIKYIYNKDRCYKIIETSHSSGFLPDHKKVLPDTFAFVSQYQIEKFKRFKIPSCLVEYPIENYNRPDRETSLKKLNLDPAYKHVLNVGLFTPGKNQEYAFKLAKFLEIEKIKFHFIGNQADNFRSYWEPLMRNKPDNCIIHGERNDVDEWYAACDLLLFTSTNELNPLVPREALSWSLPILMNNLPIYLNTYNDYSLVNFLSDDLFEDSIKISKLLKIPYENVITKKSIPKIKLVHLLTKPNDERELKSVESLSKLKDFGIDYIQHINEPCKEYPKDFKPIQEHKIKKPGYYGAYKAFRDAVEKEFDDDLDFLMICECDCVLSVDAETFANKLFKICKKVENYKIDYFSFGPHIDNNTGEVWSNILKNLDCEIFVTNKIILAHCIMFRKDMRDYLLEKYQELGWDSPDLWFDYAIFNYRKKGLLHHPLAEQYEGMSLIDTKENKGTVFKIEKNNFIDSLNDVYKSTKIKHNLIDENIKINVNFVNGPFAELKTTDNMSDSKYSYEFFDGDFLIYEDTLSPNNWTRMFRRWFTKWTIKISKDNQEIFNHTLNLENKRVLISIDSSSLGDNIAWIPYVEEFRKKHNCKVFCSTFWNNLFINSYPDITFISPGETVDNLYACYPIGCYMPENDIYRHPFDWRTIPLQKVASDILGLKYREIRPKIDTPYVHLENQKDKNICISIHSTCQAKYWNHPNGWQDLIKYLKSIDYNVYHISKETGEYMGNKPLRDVLDQTGNKSIEERIITLKNSSMFIGVSSGLAWLAWALNIPTVIISGVTNPFNEPDSMLKIHEYDVCNGCINNTNYSFDKGNWNWCPNNQNFICSKSITPQKVIKTISPILLSETNIEEQKYWNDTNNWITANAGESWSKGVGGTDNIWNIFLYPNIKDYLKGNVLEIGPGLGRITEFLSKESNHLYLVDLNQYCIDMCRERFSNNKNISYFVNDGKSLNDIPDNSLDLIISFDCFVHIHQTVIEQYLKEMYSKLKDSGVCCIHHSNLVGGQNLSFRNIGGRSNMSPSIFKLLCEKNQFEIITQKPIVMNDKITDCLSFFKKTNKESLRFIITCNIYNGQDYISRCIDSVKNQKYSNYRCFIVDDMSTDNTVKNALISIDGDPRFSVIVNKKKLGSLGNLYYTLHRPDIHSKDVVISLDGDDFLPDSEVLDRISNEYLNNNIWLTYGSFNQLQDHILKDGWSYEVDLQNLRNREQLPTHLKTFLVKLFRKIKKDDLIDIKTNYFYQSSCDLAMMIPMLEMAGDKRIKFLKSINYTYNDMNPINVYKVDRQKQLDCEQEIRSRKKYSLIDDL